MAGKRGLSHFPFYGDDFAGDGVVEAMSLEQVGAYVFLLIKAWREHPCGSIPNDDAVLHRWARCTPARWRAMKAGVLRAFYPGEDGRLHQKRMERIYADILARSGRARAADNSRNEPTPSGRGNGHDKRPKPEVSDEHSASKPEANEEQNGSKSEASDEHSRSKSAHPYPYPYPYPNTKRGTRAPRARARGLDDPVFERFWSAYPRKTAPDEARKAWAGTAPGDREAIADAAAAYGAVWGAAPERLSFCPHPATWLRAGRWKDAPELWALETRGARTPPPSPPNRNPTTDEERQRVLAAIAPSREEP